ncbi:Yip1 family protein [Phenylobacterium sp.]|uniref:Yip1 family protein n=1 Tax=Phenylobacterium sp. TaxID=1871053 RepID=UPI003567BBA4
MSVVEPGSAGSSLIERVKNILIAPAATWDVIDGEAATIGGLYRSYVIPLAAIPAVCNLIGMLVFGIGGIFGISFRPSPVWLICQAIVSYALSLAMVYVLALIIEALAPSFGGTKDRMQAFKIAAYAPTASWIAGVFGLLPQIGILAILGGLYSLYLLYVGLPKLMKAPQDKATPYFAVVLVVAVVVGVVIGAITSSISRIGGPLSVASSSVTSRAVVNVPGGSVNLGDLEAASKRAQAAAEQMQSGKAVPATDPEVLKAYLPANVAGYARTEVSASGGGVGGIQGSNAEGTYTKGDANFRLAVTDMGAAGAMAGMAGAFNVKGSKETATGYEKVGRVDGRMTTESYDRSSHHGEYSVMAGDRFMISATGDNVSIDDLKAAVQSIGPGKLEGLAKS